MDSSFEPLITSTSKEDCFTYINFKIRTHFKYLYWKSNIPNKVIINIRVITCIKFFRMGLLLMLRLMIPSPLNL